MGLESCNIFTVEDILNSYPIEPEEGDYTTENLVDFFQCDKLAVVVPGDFNWKHYVLEHMLIEKFLCNAWYLHFEGTIELLNVFIK